nr:hypothetical protein CFP56_48738 [Quercus suber]
MPSVKTSAWYSGASVLGDGIATSSFPGYRRRSRQHQFTSIDLHTVSIVPKAIYVYQVGIPSFGFPCCCTCTYCNRNGLDPTIMAPRITPWLGELVAAELRAVIQWKTLVKQEPDVEQSKDGRFSDDGSNFRSSITSPPLGAESKVQLMDVVSTGKLPVILVSDGVTQIRAFLDDDVVAILEEEMGSSLVSGMQGDVLIIREMTVISTPWGSEDRHIQIYIDELEYVSHLRKSVGTPSPIEQRPEIEQMILEIGNYRRKHTTDEFFLDTMQSSDAATLISQDYLRKSVGTPSPIEQRPEIEQMILEIGNYRRKQTTDEFFLDTMQSSDAATLISQDDVAEVTNSRFAEQSQKRQRPRSVSPIASTQDTSQDQLATQVPVSAKTRPTAASFHKDGFEISAGLNLAGPRKATVAQRSDNVSFQSSRSWPKKARLLSLLERPGGSSDNKHKPELKQESVSRLPSVSSTDTPGKLNQTQHASQELDASRSTPPINNDNTSTPADVQTKVNDVQSDVGKPAEHLGVRNDCPPLHSPYESGNTSSAHEGQFAPGTLSSNGITDDGPENVSSEQQRLLDDPSCWIPSLVGKQFPMPNVPVSFIRQWQVARQVKKTLIKSDSSDSESSETSSEDGSENSVSTDEPISKEQWPSSPERGTLPPDSTLEERSNMTEIDHDDDSDVRTNKNEAERSRLRDQTTPSGSDVSRPIGQSTLPLRSSMADTQNQRSAILLASDLPSPEHIRRGQSNAYGSIRPHSSSLNLERSTSPGPGTDINLSAHSPGRDAPNNQNKVSRQNPSQPSCLGNQVVVGGGRMKHSVDSPGLLEMSPHSQSLSTEHPSSNQMLSQVPASPDRIMVKSTQFLNESDEMEMDVPTPLEDPALLHRRRRREHFRAVQKPSEQPNGTLLVQDDRIHPTRRHQIYGGSMQLPQPLHNLETLTNHVSGVPKYPESLESPVLRQMIQSNTMDHPSVRHTSTAKKDGQGSSGLATGQRSSNDAKHRTPVVDLTHNHEEQVQTPSDNKRTASAGKSREQRSVLTESEKADPQVKSLVQPSNVFQEFAQAWNEIKPGGAFAPSLPGNVQREGGQNWKVDVLSWGWD